MRSGQNVARGELCPPLIRTTLGQKRMDTKTLRLILLKRDSSDRIERAAQELTEFLQSQPDTELLTVKVIEELDPATLDGSEIAVVLGGDGAIIRACRQL